MVQRQKNTYLYILVILILLAIIFSALFRAQEDYEEYKNIKAYFNQPNPPIQDWMNIKLISNNFNLSHQEIFDEMNVDGTKINPHISLNRFCKESHQNCTLLVEKLNNRTRR